MTEKKPGLMDYGIQVLRMLLGDKTAPPPADAPQKPAKITIEDVSIDDLTKEQVRLDLEKRRLLMELRQIEADKRKYFDEAVKNSSERERVALAREIDSLDQRAKNKDSILRSIEKQKQIIEGLLLVKERARLLKDSGLASIIGSLDLGDLVQYIDTACVDGEFTEVKLDGILRTLGQADTLTSHSPESQRTMDILKQIEEARMAADDPQVIEQRYKEMNEEIARHKGRLEMPEEEF